MVAALETAGRLTADEAEHRGANQPLRLRDRNGNLPPRVAPGSALVGL